jgi:cytoskeletal protein CcmA (bactofilin family)
MRAALPVRPLGVALVAALASCGMPPADGGAPAGDGGRELRLGGDFIAARGELAVAENVPGDVIVGGGSIAFSGSADGDYLGAGGQQTIAGTVGGDVRAVGGQIELGATVMRNVTLAGGQVGLLPGSSVGRNAYVTGGSLHAAGHVEGALTMSGGDVTIDGTVGGDVVVNAGTLRIGPGARIGGDLRYRVPEEGATIDPGAQVDGRTIVLPPPADRRSWPGVLRLIWLGGFLLAGALAILLFPVTAARAADTLVAHSAVSFGFGLLWLIAGPIAALVLAISVIGLPLAFIVGTVWGIGLFLAPAVIALWLGRRFLGSRIGTGRAGLVGSFLAAGSALVLIGLVPILGPLALFAAALAGIGALVHTFTGPVTI